MNNTKRVLMLGGSRQQIPAIQKAKEMGLYVITCDYLPDNPAHQYADKYYNISTTDIEAVYHLAEKEKVDGIVCYASDPSAYPAAYASEKIGLSTNPPEAVKILTNKDLFRDFLEQNGFCTPIAKSYCNSKLYKDDILSMGFPVLVKPVDSSGSKGITVVDNIECMENAIENALLYSRRKCYLVEQYVEKEGYQVAGDGFAVNGQLVFWCFGNDHFDPQSPNPLVPVAASFPCLMPDTIQRNIVNEINRLFSLLGIQRGAFNFDIRVGRDEQIYLMEVGPRNGGNYIPQVIKLLTRVDMVEYTIKSALGDVCEELCYKKTNGYACYYALHALYSGTLESITFQEELKKNIVDTYYNFYIGDVVPAYTGSSGTIGILILHFDNMSDMLKMIENANELIKINITK